MRISDWSSDVCSSDLASHFEIAQHHHGVAQIGDVQGRIHRANQAVLGEDKDGEYALLSQIAEQFMHLQDQEPLVGHRAEIAVEAVDHDDARAVLLHAGADIGRERSEEHTSELQSLMRISYAVFCLKKKKHIYQPTT